MALSPGPAIIAKAPPKDLVDTAEYAENLFEAAGNANWKECEAQMALLRRSSASNPDLESDVVALETSVRLQQSLQAMKMSNEITRRTAEIMRQYRTSAPVEISLLDYEGRKLQTDAASSDLAGLRQTARDTRRIWNDVRNEVERRGGIAEARDFEGLAKRLEAATTPSDYDQIAAAILDQVDKLEGVFTRNPR